MVDTQAQQDTNTTVAPEASHPKRKKKSYKTLHIVLLLLAFTLIFTLIGFFTRNGILMRLVVGNNRNQIINLQEQITRDNTFPEDVTEVKNERFNFYYSDRDSEASSVVRKPLIINIHGGGLIASNKDFNRIFNAQFAQRGFVVAAVSYPMAPEHDIFAILNGLSRNIDDAVDAAEKYGADNTSIYLTADSAGALLAYYLAALHQNPVMVKEFKVSPISTEIRAMGFVSGMYYSVRADDIGLFMSNQYYGAGWQFNPAKRWFYPDFVISQIDLPPIFLMSSDGDNLQHYSHDFAHLLEEDHVDYEYKNFEDAELGHDFPIFEPSRPESAETVDLITDFFERH